MKERQCFLLFLTLTFITLLMGCSSDTPPQSKPTQPASAGTFNYQLNVMNIRALDTASGRYVLWLRMIGDTAWYAKPPTYWTVGSGSLDFLGIIQLPHLPDSIETVFVSIESSNIPARPTSILMTGVFDSTADSSFVSATNLGGLGDYSNAKASVIFTTKSSDTNRAKSEFYLMNLIHEVPSPSATNFPIPPPGWNYGLWVLDSNFYPMHRFFYGAFTNADSSDSDPRNDEFPFPGGFKPAQLNDPGARLEITLEPDFALLGDHRTGPSPLTLLWKRLHRFINYNDTLTLANVWNSSAPHGTFTISK